MFVCKVGDAMNVVIFADARFSLYLYQFCNGAGLVQHNTPGREQLSCTEGEPV